MTDDLLVLLGAAFALDDFLDDPAAILVHAQLVKFASYALDEEPYVVAAHAKLN